MTKSVSPDQDGVKTAKYTLLAQRHRNACLTNSGSAHVNSVLIYTVQVLNTDNLHPDAANQPKPATPALAPLAAAAVADSAAKFHAHQEMDCDGSDLFQHQCSHGASALECTEEVRK